MFKKELLEKVMEEKNFTAYKLWKTSNVAQSTISTILSGNNLNPSTKTLDKIASALGVPTSAFFDGGMKYINTDKTIDYRQSLGRVNRLAESHLTQDEVILLSRFRTLNSTGKKEAIKRVDELAMIGTYIDDDLMPIAAHDMAGDFSDEDIKHDIDIMNDDNFWKK